MLELARFVTVRRYLGVLPIRVFPGLLEPPSLFLEDLVAVRDSPGWELAQELAHELLLLLLLLPGLLSPPSGSLLLAVLAVRYVRAEPL